MIEIDIVSKSPSSAFLSRRISLMDRQNGLSRVIAVILQIPTALAPNYSTLMAMRFFGGFVCSPALSTGGATLSDVYSAMVVPYVVAGWASGAVLG